MKWLLIFFLSHCFLVFGSSLEECLEGFAEGLLTNRFEECLLLLDKYEEEHWQNNDLMNALRATVLLSTGKLEESSSLMAESISVLERSFLPSKCASLIRDLYEKAWEFYEKEDSYYTRNSSPTVRLCKETQPKGVKFKFWLGVGQIAAGCLLAPVSGGLSTALIASGAAMTADAVADSLNNMDQWEKNLNERQKIDPNNLPPPPPNRLPPPQKSSNQVRWSFFQACFC